MWAGKNNNSSPLSSVNPGEKYQIGVNRQEKELVNRPYVLMNPLLPGWSQPQQEAEQATGLSSSLFRSPERCSWHAPPPAASGGAACSTRLGPWRESLEPGDWSVGADWSSWSRGFRSERWPRRPPRRSVCSCAHCQLWEREQRLARRLSECQVWPGEAWERFRQYPWPLHRHLLQEFIKGYYVHVVQTQKLRNR